MNRDTEVSKEKEDSNSDPEETAINPNADFATKMLMSLRCLIVFLHFSGKFPIRFTPIEDGIYTCSIHYKSLSFVYFCLTSIILCYSVVFILFNVCLISFNLDGSGRTSFPLDQLPENVRLHVRLRELVVIKRYLIILIAFGTALLQSVFSTIIMIIRREYLANYFGFWSR